MMLRKTGALLGAALIALGSGAVQAAPAPLRIVTVDVEGGAATLFVTPEGKSLLIDTGWPPGLGGPRAADRPPGLAVFGPPIGRPARPPRPRPRPARTGSRRRRRPSASAGSISC